MPGLPHPLAGTPPGELPLSRLGHNYRLADPLAAIARANLARFGHLLKLRQHQASLLSALLAGTPAITPLAGGPGWNGYAPLARLNLPRPRQFCPAPGAVQIFGQRLRGERQSWRVVVRQAPRSVEWGELD